MSVPGGDGKELIPLWIAAELWRRTHAVERAATDLADDGEVTATLNGEQIGAAVRVQNDETNPIFRPEAE
jgi:hypothetical protein